MMIGSGTVTHRPDELERRGMVARRRGPSGRRGVLVWLTAAGRQPQDRAMASHLGVEARLLSGFTERRRGELAGLLRHRSTTAVVD